MNLMTREQKRNAGLFFVGLSAAVFLLWGLLFPSAQGVVMAVFLFIPGIMGLVAARRRYVPKHSKKKPLALSMALPVTPPEREENETIPLKVFLDPHASSTTELPLPVVYREAETD